MTDDASDEIVTFRLAPQDRAAIQRLIQRGEFRNRSDFLRYAVKTTLRDHAVPPPTARQPAAPKLDLELEGVQLPDAGAATGRKRAASGRLTRGRSP